MIRVSYQAGNLAGNNILKGNNRNTRTRCEICSKLPIKTLERQWCLSVVFIINYEHISYLFFSVSIVNFVQVNASWAEKLVNRD